MTPEQLVATQWIDQIRGQIVLPHATVSTCSNGGRMIDFAVISPVLARNVELTVDLEALFAPTQQLVFGAAPEHRPRHDDHTIRPPAVPWKPEKDITPEFANEIWSGKESIEPHCARPAVAMFCVEKHQLFFIRLAPLLPFSSPRFNPGLRGCRHTGTFGTTYSRHQTCQQRDRLTGWKPLGAEDPGFERQASQAAISGETRLLRIPSRDGGTRSQHVWRIALQSASLHTLVLSYTHTTFSKS